MKYSKASAPGKIHLIGEHSAVYGRPAILAAINKRIFVEISKSQTKKTDKAIFAIQKYLNKKYKIPVENFEIKSYGDLPIGQGLGSSASYSAALATALFDYYKLNFDLDEIFNASYEGEKFFHGNPSGGDLASVIHGGIIYFRKESENVKLVRKILPKKTYNFFAVDSGKALESTREMVVKVSRLSKNKIAKFCNEQELLAKKMAEEMINGDDISNTINSSEANLEHLGVVGLPAVKIIGILGSLGISAKISGGGGVKKGSGMILALNQTKENIKSFDEKFNILRFEIENSGIRVEK